MKRIAILLFAVITILDSTAQPTFIPEDLSYDFRITKIDLGLKGNIKSISQEVSNMNTAPANYIHLVLYQGFNKKIFEETQEPVNDYMKFRTPIITQLQGFTCDFANGSNNIENVSWTTFHGLNSFNYYYTYDTNNNITSVITDGKYKKSFLLTYENSRLIKKDVECKVDEEVYPSSYKYDSQGRVIEVISIPTHKGKENGDPSIRTYTYSAEGDKTKVVSTCSNYKFVFGEAKRNRESYWIYDNNGLLVESEMCVTKKNGKPFRASSGNQAIYTKIHSTYEYNSQGKLKTRNDDYFDEEGGMFSSGAYSCNKKITYSYDSNGNIVRQQEHYYTPYSELGTVLYKFSYEYDSHDNWISKEAYVNGVLQSITTREITYWE